eukprot:Gregarina_sp_Poly_1__2238@NODE_159_length_12283_cov_147_306729_g141_i0_p10_GENE_NODE_159_length_12283_cov_147_306729_g141_i0NODE_159_length_12283_cov_147_306729_g141_i0_p10_ORF_typecomplete_len119_score5_60C2/PF00168_30/1_4e06_NODE_159_length_12283_cov_147_306729_g141_i019012257
MVAYNFVVNVISATDLTKKKAHAAVRVKLGEVVAQSSSVKGSDKSAAWNETFSLRGAGTEPSLGFSIVDPKGHVTGSGSLPVPHLLSIGVYDGAVALSGSEGPAGSLRVCVTVERSTI